MTQDHLPSYIDELTRSAAANQDWFRGYMEINTPRILSDAVFLSDNLPKDSRIVDVGAVPPLLLQLLWNNGFRNLHACDPHADVFHQFFDSKNIPYKNTDVIRNTNALDGKYDCILLCEVIEHLSGNLLAILDQLTQSISTGGYLFLTTPNLRSISGLFAILRHGSGLASKPWESVRAQYERAGSECGYFGHIREYTSKEVIALVKSLGFKLVARDMLPRYYATTRGDHMVVQLERLFPNWRLFAKFLFKKIR